jgi:N-acetylglutamate synthase-like GNAT family acetyltransferase
MARKNKTIRSYGPDELGLVEEIINDSAQAYKGVIPPDFWREPYLPLSELKQQAKAGVIFFGTQQEGKLAGVIGMELVQDVTLIRHNYVRTAFRNRGIGGQLLEHVHAMAPGPVLVGTWIAAAWAITFYEQHGFRQVIPAERDRLLKKYWSMPARQIEVSMVMADNRWFSTV